MKVLAVKNIIQVIPSISSAHGGPSTGASQLSLWLNKWTEEPTLLSGDPASADLGFTPPKTLLRFTGSRAVRILKVFKFLALHSECEGVFIHGLHRPLSWGCGLIARVKRIPYVVQLHGTLEPYEFQRHPVRKRVFMALVGSHFLRNARGVVVASNSESQNALAAVRGITTWVIPLGVIKEQPTPASRIAESLVWRNSQRASRVLFLGRLAKKKHPEVLIDALPLCKGMTLIFAGPEGFWTEATLRSRIDADANQRVMFVGEVHGGEKAWLFSECGIFVLPSDNENFAIAAAEAQAYGCASVLTPEVAVSEYVLEARSGSVLGSLESSVWADELTDWLRNPQKAETAGAAGRATADQIFSWERFSSEILQRWTAAS